jgi:uncharacterized protein YuzE
MNPLHFEIPDNSSLQYDHDADVLYISFGAPQPAVGLDLGSGIIARYVEKSHKVVGFTLIGVKNTLKAAK